MVDTVDIGNAEAAQDLYGLGVRIGLYLQAASFTFSLFVTRQNQGKGVKIASGTIILSVLSSWFTFATREEFSPCEAVIVQLMLIGALSPAMATFLISGTVVDEVFAAVLMVLVNLGLREALTWTFGWLVTTLPRLGTDNLGFCFYPVSLTGWFRYIALASCAIENFLALRLAYIAYKVLPIILLSSSEQLPGNNIHETTLRRIEDKLKWKYWEETLLCYTLGVEFFMLVSVETTIAWNNLTPSQDLQSSGQLIPLLTGIILLLASVLTFGQRLVNGSPTSSTLLKLLVLFIFSKLPDFRDAFLLQKTLTSVAYWVQYVSYKRKSMSKATNIGRV